MVLELLGLVVVDCLVCLSCLTEFSLVSVGMDVDVCFFLMIRRPPRSTQSRSSAASDVYKRQPSQSLAVMIGALK